MGAESERRAMPAWTSCLGVLVVAVMAGAVAVLLTIAGWSQWTFVLVFPVTALAFWLMSRKRRRDPGDDT